MDVKNFGKVQDQIRIPELTDIQTVSYARFLQLDAQPDKRKNEGLEAILRETFPIYNYDQSLSLEYISYELDKPRYTPDECRQIKKTFGYPLRVKLRLNKDQPMEEDVYLGELPVMTHGGEFIINGAERVIVTQLHRSPGVDFIEETESAERKIYSCRIIPERGSWIEINVTKKDALSVKIDQSGALSATCLLRAMSEKYSSDADILRLFYKTEKISLKTSRSAQKLIGAVIVGDLVDTRTGEVILESGEVITKNVLTVVKAAKLDAVEVIREVDDPILLNTLKQDTTHSHDEALLKIYQRLRPGNPAKIDKARELFRDKFFDPNRYRLGRVGRFRLNRKFEQNVPETEMILSDLDYLNALRYMLILRKGEGKIDDIDHLGNRRLRTIDELASDEVRKGFLKLRRTVQERMSLKDASEVTPRSLVNSKTVSSAIEYFFGRSELSQVVDQTNPLAMLTHERRLSALGPGGLNRKRAGFEVRDVHISHYGRICPIETPEGTNIGLISSLSLFSAVDRYGFLTSPYLVVKKGKVTGEVVWLRADEEEDRVIGSGDLQIDEKNRIVAGALAGHADDIVPEGMVLARINGEFTLVTPEDIEFLDVSPKQMVGVSAALIPFLEHDDANRALMGSNMQRQAVPLLTSEPPLVATGIEKVVAENSGMVIRATEAGEVKYVSADKIVIGAEEYELRKFVGLNERTCLNQRPIVRLGDTVKKGQVIADGAATKDGELALGKNVLVAFMPFDGFNFEDAIIISEELVEEDTYTSIHIEEFEIEIRETKLGKEEFTRDIPNVSERALKNLDETGVVRVGTHVGPGDILVGKVSPKSKSELSPEEKLLRAIFGRAGEDVKNDSLEVPGGVGGVVIDTRKFSRKAYLTDKQKREQENEIKKVRIRYNRRIANLFKEMIETISEALGGKMVISATRKPYKLPTKATVGELLTLAEEFDIKQIRVPKNKAQAVQEIYRPMSSKIEKLTEERDRIINNIKRGDELEPGVIEMVKVYMATKRVLAVGDKMAGRHGNKGVISRVMPKEDMPFLDDGTPVQIMLNPLGVPSRMNVGQILETHLGWAAKLLGYQAVNPVFSSAAEEQIVEELEAAGLNHEGTTQLFDGRTGEAFDQRTTVGYIYMMKLNHLVDDKVHARATGPYSLITQQPLGGKARSGGQRFGEMEVWALEAYGAAYILQELLTVKSDDVEGRTKIYEAMVKGTNTLQAGTPVSFDVFMNEIRGLGLNIMMEKSLL